MGVVHGYLLIKLAKYCAYLGLLLFFQALIFFGEVLLFMNWAPVGDMVLVRQKHFSISSVIVIEYDGPWLIRVFEQVLLFIQNISSILIG